MRTDEGRWRWPIIWGTWPIVEVALGAALVTIFLSSRVFIDELRIELVPTASNHRNRWLAIHLLCVGCTGIWFVLGVHGEVFTQLEVDLWFFFGAAILIATAATWYAAFLPFSFWSSWLRRSPSAFAVGGTIGVLARCAGSVAQMFPALQHYTFVTAARMLWMLGSKSSLIPRARCSARPISRCT
jgi:hypothetical protein